ncbi:MAG TPA: enoyl-CoA hydratase/isomerase family protein [Pyrinomonadaceae bacterium]
MKTLSRANEYIAEESGEGIFTLRFCRPAERNTLSSETLTVLAEILERISTTSSVRAVILTGTDDVFLSGANIRELTKLDSFTAIEFSKRGQELTQRLADLKPVTIAAINGYCMGGGLDFALACDIRVASTNASFAHPGAKLGIITGWGGTQRLPRIVGRTKAIELFATARRLNSVEALEAGLVTEVGDPVLEIAMRIAKSTL